MKPLIIGIVLAYAGIVLAACGLQRSLMYFPGGALPDPPEGFIVRQVRTADGLQLTGWYAPPAAPGRAVIVYFQGNGGNIAGRLFKVEAFVEAGYGVLLAGYRGYGGNPGSPTEEGLYADARAWLDSLEGAPAVLLGESLGTGVAVRMASERPVAAVILEAPYSSAVDVGAAAYWFLPVRAVMRDRFPSIDVIAKIGAPLLVIHGERDRVIPIRFGRRLFAAAREPKQMKVYPTAGHNDLPRFGLIEDELAFLKSLDREAPPS